MDAKEKASSHKDGSEKKSSTDTSNSKKTEDTKKKASTTASVQKKTKLAESVLKPEEISHIIDLGLGRGVNATVPSPWLHKSTFQVQEVTADNVIGTEEGGILQSYVDEVASVEEIQSLMSSSVPVSDKVTIGVDAELSRTYSTSRRSLGKKLITRSVSFKPDFDALLEHKAVPSGSPTAPTQTETKPLPDKDSEEIVLCDPAPAAELPSITPNFEQRLALWILESLMDEEFEGLELFDPNDDPIGVLANFILKWDGGARELKQLLRRKCREFVNHFNITHYVSGIDLGASQYQVMSEQQYQEQVGVKNKLEILQFASTSTERNRKSLQKKNSSKTTEIGRFDGSTVHRGTTDEAVVSVELEPISVLIKVRVLRIALQKAIKDYIDEQEFSRAGPFIISCSDESIFLKVNSNFQVVATRKIEDSSDFYISYNEDGRSAYEFSINHLLESPLVGREVKPISRYLYAPVNGLGNNRGPLTLTLAARNKHTVMTLHSRRVGHFDPVDTKDWLNSRDIFYISCKQRTIGRNSYICVKRTPRGFNLPDEFVTYCVPSIKRHDESREHYMLFRLLRASKRDYAEKTQEIDSDNEPLGIRTTLRRTSSSGLHLPFGFKLPFMRRSAADSGPKDRSQKENVELVEVEGETEM